MPAAVHLTVGTPTIISQADDTQVRGYPHAARFSDGCLCAHFYICPWSGRDTTPASCISRDDGRSWSDERAMPVGPASEPLILGDDTLVYFNELRIEDPRVIAATRCESSDRGESFQEDPDGAVFHLPEEIRFDPDSAKSYWGQCDRFVYQYGFLREDAIVWTLVGGHCEGSGWCRLMLFRSCDEGRTFRFVSTIAGADDPGHSGYSEPSICRMTDGSLLVIARIEYSPDNWRSLACFRSDDDGGTWSSQGIPVGIPSVYRIRRQRPVSNSGKTHASAGNVSPSMAVLANGVAALSFGRPGLKVAFSADGTGDLWSDTLRVVPEESLFGRNDRGSGMSAVVPIDANRFVLVYDVAGYDAGDRSAVRDTVFALEIQADPA